MDVQPLPQRPGAMAVRPKGQVTAGRPLPPYPGEVAPVAAVPAAQVAPPAQPAATQPATSAAAAVSGAQPQRPAPPEARNRAHGSSRPDPRSMRMAFGASAVAAVSVMAVGFVQPDFAESAQQPAEVEENSLVDAPPSDTRGVRVRVRHVINYVFLEPGQRAPRGATVISPQEARERTGKKRRPARAAGDSPTRSTRDRERTPPISEPAQRPKAPVTTRQSG